MVERQAICTHTLARGVATGWESGVDGWIMRGGGLRFRPLEGARLGDDLEHHDGHTGPLSTPQLEQAVPV